MSDVVSGRASSAAEPSIDSLVFVAFNSQVVALDRYSGETQWTWKSPKGSGYVTILLDGDRLIVSVMGYTYCLDPIYGQEVWRNELEGMGVGVPSLASWRSANANTASAAAAAAQQQAAANAAIVT